MTERVGGASVELSADANKFTAGIGAARKSLRDLAGDAKTTTKSASDSIDRYIKRLEVQAATVGKSAREQELYKLAVRGATREQLASADAALRMSEAYARGERIGQALRRGTVLAGAAIASLTTTLVAGVVVLDKFINKAAAFQDGAEKIGDTAENLASLSVAANVSGLGLEGLVAASVKLTKNLTGVDDESKAAGAAIAALGLNLKEFKALQSAEQIEAIARAMEGFADGNEKTAVAIALLGKSGADALPFFKELIAEGGRQVILTQEQIRAADEYADRNARVRAELDLYAQSIATRAIPASNAMIEALGETIAKLLGLRHGISDLAQDNKIVEFAERSARGLAVIADAAFFVGRSIGALGDLIGGAAAAQTQLLQGNFRAAQAISAATAQTLKDTQFALGLSKNLDARLAGQASKFKDPRILGPVGSIEEQTKALGIGKPRLKFSGAEKSDKSGAKSAAREAEQEAKAQLAFELDLIKRGSATIVAANANKERLLEAQRAAGLTSEREYYEAKHALARANIAEEERAARAEIARLQQQVLSGKDKIDNDRKIAAIESDLAVKRAAAATNETILSLQQVSALNKVSQAYRDAKDAAEDFLASLRKTQQDTLGGAGLGNVARDRTSGRAQIEEKFNEQRQALERQRRDAQLSGTFGTDAQRQYDDELSRIRRFQAVALAEYDVYFAQRRAQEQDWTVGAKEALANYYDESANISSQVADLFTSAFQGMEDALVAFVTTGKLNFNSLANSIVADITRIIVKQQILGPLTQSLSGGLGGGGIFSSLLSGIFGGGGFGSGLAASYAKAGGGMAQPYSIQRVNEKGPELLSVAGKEYLMMGANPGRVTPNAGGANNITMNLTQTFPETASRATTLQAAADAQRMLQRGARNL